MFWGREICFLDSEEESDPLGFWTLERDLLSSQSPLVYPDLHWLRHPVLGALVLLLACDGLLLVLLLCDGVLSRGLGGERTGHAGCLEDLSGDDDLLLLEELGTLVVSG